MSGFGKIEAAVPVSDRTAALERFQASLERASADPSFLDRFYDSFMAISPEIAGIFEHSNMDRLKRKLKSSLHLMTLAAEQAPGADDYLRFLGRTHRRFAIEPEHFSLWLASLIATARRCDPDFDRQLESDWKRVLQCGIDLMQDAFEQPAKGSRDAGTEPRMR